MPFHLFLLRHAETEPQQSGQSDFDRELLSIGKEQIAYLTQHLSQLNFHIDSIICSSAKRARTTVTLLCESLEIPLDKVRFKQFIYTTEAKGLVEFIRQTDPTITRLLIVGHNPTLSDLGNYLIKNFADGLRTCDMVWVELDIQQWSDLKKNSGKLNQVLHGNSLNQ